MDYINTLIERLRKYSQPLVAYKLDADFADACAEAADKLEKWQSQNERLKMMRPVEFSGDAANSFVLAAKLSEARNEIKRLKSLLSEHGQDLWSAENQRADKLAQENERLTKELRKYENLEEQLSDECALRDEIAELKAENDKMRPFYTTADTHFKLWEKTAMDAYEERNRAKAELEKLQAKLDRVTRERDAAVEDMKCIADNSMCECCVHNNSGDEEQFCDKNTIVYGCNQFEWRGLKEA